MAELILSTWNTNIKLFWVQVTRICYAVENTFLHRLVKQTTWGHIIGELSATAVSLQSTDRPTLSRWKKDELNESTNNILKLIHSKRYWKRGF